MFGAKTVNYCDVECFAWEMNRNNSVIFVYCISDSSVDYEDYSISSKGFLPTIEDIMVI